MSAARHLDALDDASPLLGTVGKLRSLLRRELAAEKVSRILEEVQDLGPVNHHKPPSPEMRAEARRMLRRKRGLR